MPPRKPSRDDLAHDLQMAEKRITAALDLHRPVTSRYGITGISGPVVCRLCRDPYPCDTAQALGGKP